MTLLNSRFPSLPFLSHLLPVHVDMECLRRVASRQPTLGVLVVKGPWRHHDEEGKRGAGKTSIEGQADVLCEVADEEGDDLGSL